MDENNFSPQNIILESRKRLNLSGIKNVISFDDETINIDSCLGKITVKGENLHIESFITETGDLVATGKFHAVVYISDEKSEGGFFSKIFR